MFSNGYVMMQMSSFRYAMIPMSPYGYAMMQMSLCRNAMMQMPPYGYAMMRNLTMQTQFIRKILLFFKSRLPQRLEPKHFQNSIYYSQKVIHFLTKDPQKIGDHYQKSLNGTLTWKSDDLAQKIYFHGLIKGMVRVQGLFLKTRIL